MYCSRGRCAQCLVVIPGPTASSQDLVSKSFKVLIDCSGTSDLRVLQFEKKSTPAELSGKLIPGMRRKRGAASFGLLLILNHENLGLLWMISGVSLSHYDLNRETTDHSFRLAQN